ncbi:hypothetical protein BCR33DRAFT_556824 [Rhizoclosmatium globosum]|uniref:F-box domain-containing protein n=1 Tax=Rhizoclosmatium globosum TaxID=329046 RepID=A0A1Y2CSA8_9FUNG|nr:hypothetical protein BCR33DRAFT_556824 [Rhizoclosmatium globosum]|eukprot:ORY49929.1 hypothetical protein BCR33DRAFT_556824 [Rhizoclosmatium globosum]
MTSLAEHTETQILPNEVLQSIFEKLDISQLLIVGQVNTQWRENSRSSSIWRNMNLSISEKGILCSMSGHYRSTLPNSTQPITLKPTIRFAQLHKGYILESSNIVHMTRSIAVTKHLTTSLKDQLNLVQHLNAPLHDISDHHLIKFLTHMPSLRHISLERCRSLTVNVIPFLPTLVRGLVSIDLSNTYMDDSALRFLVRNSPFWLN